VKPDGFFLILKLMHFAHEVLEPESLKSAEGAEVTPRELEMAKQLIGALGHMFTMPNAKVRRRDGKPHKLGIDGLMELIGKRLQLDLIFADRKVARHLVEKSGGSIRDLIRLLDDVQLIAQVNGKPSVDMSSAKKAVRKLCHDMTRGLIPSSVYFPILAEVHRTGNFSPPPAPARWSFG
jgi:hypothetical protein